MCLSTNVHRGRKNICLLYNNNATTFTSYRVVCSLVRRWQTSTSSWGPRGSRWRGHGCPRRSDSGRWTPPIGPCTRWTSGRTLCYSWNKNKNKSFIFFIKKNEQIWIGKESHKRNLILKWSKLSKKNLAVRYISFDYNNAAIVIMVKHCQINED